MLSKIGEFISTACAWIKDTAISGYHKMKGVITRNPVTSLFVSIVIIMSPFSAIMAALTALIIYMALWIMIWIAIYKIIWDVMIPQGKLVTTE